MSRDTNILTNLELLEVFLKTQGSAPGTRGAILCDNASKQLLRRINQPSGQPTSCLAGDTIQANPSQAQSASCSASSLLRSMETGPGLEPVSQTQPVPPYPYTLQSLRQEYLKAGVAISAETLKDMESALEEALSRSTDRAYILEFLKSRGFGKYVQEK